MIGWVRTSAAISALWLLFGCDEGPRDPEDSGLGAARMGETEQTVRVVTANLAHVSWSPTMLDRNDVDDPQLLAWLQVQYLETLESPGPTIFNTQEMSQGYWKTGFSLWPTVFRLSLGGSASDPEYADYGAWYQPILSSGEASWGNAILTNLEVQDDEAWNLNAAWSSGDAWDPADVSNPYASCGGTAQRGAQVVQTEVGGVDLWSVDVHLEFCAGGDFAINACNLERLLARLRTLPSDDVVLVSGDFNIRQSALASDDCPGALHPARFDQMVRGFADQQFLRVETVLVDHVFLRDPNFELTGMRNRTFAADYEADRTYEMSDHDFIETELEVGGQGMSPAMLPLYVTLN